MKGALQMTKLNIAVVGAGLYGKNHLDAYSVNSNVNLVAVCDLNREITDRVAKEYGVKTYNDIEEMLNNEEIDAVSVANLYPTPLTFNSSIPGQRIFPGQRI